MSTFAAPADHQLLTVAEVATILRVSKSHLSKLINGQVPGTPPLPAARLGRRLLIRKKCLDEWLFLVDTSRGLG